MKRNKKNEIERIPDNPQLKRLTFLGRKRVTRYCLFLAEI